MKRTCPLSFVLLSLALPGCGGTKSDENDPSPRPVVFAPTDAGPVVFAVTPTVPAGTNASPASLDLGQRASFTGAAYGDASGYGIDAVLSTKDGRTFTLHAFSREPFVPGASWTLQPDPSVTPSLVYEEGGLGAGSYRKWASAGGTLTLDRVDAEGGVAHLSAVRMVARQDGIGGDAGFIQSTSTGEFTFDGEIHVVRNRGSVAFTDAATAALKYTGFASPDVSLSAFAAPASGPGGFGFNFFLPNSGENDADENGGAFDVVLDPKDKPVRAGQTFAIGANGSSAMYVGYYPHDTGLGRVWRATSGTATIRELHGRVGTVDLADVRMKASANGATGTFTASGSVVVEFP